MMQVILSTIQLLHDLIIVGLMLDTLNHEVGRHLNDNKSTFK